MNSTGSALKYVLFLFNLVFVLCGVLLMIWGATALKSVKDLIDLEGTSHTTTLPILAILLGSTIFVVSFFGCCGIITENVCCTYTYAVFMFILTLLQITFVVWMFINREKFLQNMDDLLKAAYNKNDDYNGYPMDPIQLIFKCCGMHSYKDYNGDVPNTCCGYPRLSKETCEEEVYSKRPGCHIEFKEFWQTNTNLVRWVGIIIAVVELIVLWYACTLATKIRTSA